MFQLIFADSATVWKVGAERPMKAVRVVDDNLPVTPDDNIPRVMAPEPATVMTNTTTVNGTTSGSGSSYADNHRCKNKESRPGGRSKNCRLQRAE